MNLLDIIVKNYQYKILINNFQKQELKVEAYAEGIRSINEALNLSYQIKELFNLKFRDMIEIMEFYDSLPLKS